MVRYPNTWSDCTYTMNLQTKIKQKEDQLKDLQEIRASTGVLAEQLEQFEKKLDEMAGGAENVALVLSNWQNVMNTVSMASLGLLEYSKKDYETGRPIPEPLVRIGLDEDLRTVDEEGAVGEGMAADSSGEDGR